MENSDRKTIEKDGDYAVLEFSRKESKKKRRIRALLLLLFNILVIGIIVIVEVTGNSQKVPIGDVLKTWGKNWVYLVALLGIVALDFSALALKFAALIKTMTGQRQLKLSFSTAVLGKYYDYVTPFGTGGQPFQMFNLGRKLDVGVAASLPIVSYLVQEFVSVVIQIVIFCTTSYVMKDNRFMEVAAYIGLLAFAAAPITVLLFSIFPRAISGTAKFFCRIGHKLHLVKDVDKAQQKAIAGVQRYSDSLKFISGKWRTILILIVLSAIYSWGFNSIPFFVLKTCGIEDVSYIETVSMSYYVYSAITIIPTPGGAGAAEGAFYAIFKPLTGPYMFWGTLLWRFCVYYIVLIIGFGVTVYQNIQAMRKEKRRSATVSESADTQSPDVAEASADTDSADPQSPDRAEASADTDSADIQLPDRAEASADTASADTQLPDSAETPADTDSADIQSPDRAEAPADTASADTQLPDSTEMSADNEKPIL